MTRTRDRGAVMAEAALIMPLLILLIFGLVEFSRAFNAQITLNHAAREGVRTYSLTRDFAQGQAAATNAATSLDPGSMSFSGTACDSGQPTELTISYPFSYEIPFFGSNTVTMTAKGVMRCEGRG